MNEYVRKLREMGRQLLDLANRMEKEGIALESPESDSKPVKEEEQGNLPVKGRKALYGAF